MLYFGAAIADVILFALHMATIFIGAPAYLFLRAGKRMAQADADGARWPALLTGFICGVFFVWATICYWASTQNAYADWASILVIAIGCIFLLRGSMVVFQIAGFTKFSDGEAPQIRDYVFSLMALGIGSLHLAAALI